MLIHIGNKLSKYILLFLAIWPLVYSLVISFWLFSSTTPPTENYTLLGLILVCNGITMGISLAGIILFLLNLYRNNLIRNNQKSKWTLGILFLSPVCLPYYWWKYIKSS